MAGLLDKIRVLGLGAAHAAVDKAIDMNSIPVLEQRVRDLESARSDAQSSLSQATYRYQSEVNALQANETTDAKMQANILTLMKANGGAPTEEQRAEAQRTALALNKLREGNKAQQQRVEQAKATLDQMKSAVDAIMEQEQTAHSRINELRMAAASTVTLNNAAKAVTRANEATSALGNIDGIADQINMKNAVATDAFKNAITAATQDDHAETDKIAADDLISQIMNNGNKSAAA